MQPILPLMPTNEFSIKPLKVVFLAGEKKATEDAGSFTGIPGGSNRIVPDQSIPKLPSGWTIGPASLAGGAVKRAPNLPSNGKGPAAKQRMAH